MKLIQHWTDLTSTALPGYRPLFALELDETVGIGKEPLFQSLVAHGANIIEVLDLIRPLLKPFEVFEISERQLIFRGWYENSVISIPNSQAIHKKLSYESRLDRQLLETIKILDQVYAEFKFPIKG